MRTGEVEGHYTFKDDEYPTVEWEFSGVHQLLPEGKGFLCDKWTKVGN